MENNLLEFIIVQMGTDEATTNEISESLINIWNANENNLENRRGCILQHPLFLCEF